MEMGERPGEAGSFVLKGASGGEGGAASSWLARPASSAWRALRAHPPRGRAGVGEKTVAGEMDRVHGPVVSDRWDRVTGMTFGCVDWVRGDAETVGPTGPYFQSRGRDPDAVCQWGPRVSERRREGKSRKWKNLSLTRE